MAHRVPKAIPKGRWRELWREILDGLEKPTSAEARLAERLVLNLMTADTAMQEAAAEPFVRGSTGQTVEHPGFRVAARSDAQALAIARELRLTPKEHARSHPPEVEEPQSTAETIRDELAARRAARA